jgi:hypothetical protein
MLRPEAQVPHDGAYNADSPLDVCFLAFDLKLRRVVTPMVLRTDREDARVIVASHSSKSRDTHNPNAASRTARSQDTRRIFMRHFGRSIVYEPCLSHSGVVYLGMARFVLAVPGTAWGKLG